MKALKILTISAVVVMASQQGPRLYVVKADGTAEVRPVRVVRSAGSESLIGEGVKAGETVVVVGQSRIVPGGKVVAEKAGKGGAR